MVIPCSRSAARPSVRSERSISAPASWVALRAASSWSVYTEPLSKSKRPMSVDLPSSTEPTATKRRSSLSW